jgi:hypothetical protein
MTIVATRPRLPRVIASALILAAAACATLTAPTVATAEEPRAPLRLMVKPKPPTPGKEVFVRTKPHVNVGGPQSPAKLKARPVPPTGPKNLTGQLPELADWYCGEGSGPGGHAVCTQDLIDSCSGTYVPPKTNGEHQTWGMCHESSGG